MAQPLTQYRELSCRLGLDQALVERLVEANSARFSQCNTGPYPGTCSRRAGPAQMHLGSAAPQGFRAKHDHIEATIMKHLQRHVFSVSHDS